MEEDPRSSQTLQTRPTVSMPSTKNQVSSEFSNVSTLLKKYEVTSEKDFPDTGKRTITICTKTIFSDMVNYNRFIVFSSVLWSFVPPRVFVQWESRDFFNASHFRKEPPLWAKRDFLQGNFHVFLIFGNLLWVAPQKKSRLLKYRFISVRYLATNNWKLTGIWILKNGFPKNVAAASKTMRC